MIPPTREQAVPDPSIRDAFERRFKEPPFEFSLERYGEQDAWPGNYKKFSEQCAWDGYQEARADLEATIAEQAAEISILQSKADALADELSGEKAAALNYRTDAIKAEKQRDELLEALETIIGLADKKNVFPDTIYVRDAIKDAIRAIASVKGAPK